MRILSVLLNPLALRWLGHIERMHARRLPKMILNTGREGGRRKGRQRKRWMDDVEKDIANLGVRNWRTKARNRVEWKAVREDCSAVADDDLITKNSYVFRADCHINHCIQFRYPVN